MSKVITRFAPSPTGFLHLGGARTALFNFLFTQKQGGKLILRIEDTDKERSKKEYEEDILAGLEWLGLRCDETFKQSEREEIYKKYLEKIISDGKAYVSKEEPKKGSERREVIRFKNPNTKIKFKDIIRGEVEFDTTDLGDFVIAKSLTEPLYHLAVVIDDFEMNVTHIIRGEDHISNTPRQILVQKAIGAPETIYAHIPLILAPDKSKLSKRHGAVSLTEFQKMGYLPEAMINYLALLGWNPGDEREILSLKEIVELFDLKKVHKGGAVFNIEKLDWINQQYLKLLSPEEKNKLVVEAFEKNKKENWPNPEFGSLFIEMIIERIQKTNDIKNLIDQGEFDYFFEKPNPKRELIPWKKDGTEDRAKKHLTCASEIIENLSEKEWNVTVIKNKLMEYADKEGRGSVLWPLRYCLSGKERSPDPFTLTAILGKKETLERWQKAKEILEG